MAADDTIGALHDWYDAQSAAGSAGASEAGSQRRELLSQIGAATTDIGGSSGRGAQPGATMLPVIEALRDWASRLVE